MPKAVSGRRFPIQFWGFFVLIQLLNYKYQIAYLYLLVHLQSCSFKSSKQVGTSEIDVAMNVEIQ